MNESEIKKVVANAYRVINILEDELDSWEELNESLIEREIIKKKLNVKRMHMLENGLKYCYEIIRITRQMELPF